MKLYMKKKKYIKFSVFFCLIAVIYLMCIASYTILSYFRPVFQEKAILLAKLRATEIINSAVIEVFSGIDSLDFVNISKKDSEEITSVTMNTVEINKIKALISKTVSDKAKTENDFYIHIPIGSLTKYPILQGMGYRIPVKVSLDGVTKTDFEEEYISAGINQVKSRIYIVVSSRISIISSLMTVSETVSTEVPVSETIIVGDVPEYYGDTIGVLGR